MPLPLSLSPTQSTPEVELDKEKNLFLIKGDVLPEDSFELFDPIFHWLEEYAKEPNESTIFELDINIINTSATRRLVKLFKILESIVANNNKVEVRWFFLSDDEIMQYAAYEFGQAFSKLNFKTFVK